VSDDARTPLVASAPTGPAYLVGDAGAADDALLAAMSQGDERAGVVFVRRYQRRVYGLALSMVGDPGRAEDIAQEAFLRAWRHAAAFDARRGTVATWLLAITRNLAIDSLRMRRGVMTCPSDPLWETMADEARSPDDEAVASEARSTLAEALAALPGEQRRALVLAAVYGYSASDVSLLEGIPLGTAKSRIGRGLRRLRDASVNFELGKAVRS